MRLELTRLPSPDPDAPTLGWLEFEHSKYATLELPWKGNARNISCITPGTYRLKPRSYGRYRDAYFKRWGFVNSIEVADVPGRGDILIHTGNLPRHTRGCILVGMRHVGNMVVDSREAYTHLYRSLIEADFEQGERLELDILAGEQENEMDAVDDRDLHDPL